MADDAVAIAAGRFHSCLIAADGTPKCWGENGSGQLGDGSNTDSNVPVPVVGLASSATAIDLGHFHSCAVTTAGAAMCWGYNIQGELGNDSSVNSNVPVGVTGLTSGVAAIAVGDSHTCALSTTGGVSCWGYNLQGQLGNGSNLNSDVPVPVSGLTTGVAAISAGGAHSCALTTSGGVMCWGRNTFGQLGDGSTTDSPVPVSVSGMSSGVLAIAAGGGHTCAITGGGVVQCWGFGGWGQLGDTTFADHPTPAPVADSVNQVTATAIAAGGSHSCAVGPGGEAWCWGNNDYGQLGDKSRSRRGFPVKVSGAVDLVAISAGQDHTCAVTSSGNAECWGRNINRELGDGSIEHSTVPVTTIGPVLATALGVGSQHSCALEASGGIGCWGLNLDGQLGDGSKVDRSVPRPMVGLDSGTAISTGSAASHSCALDAVGGVRCWGDNEFGQLGDGTKTDRTAPVAVSGLSSGVVSVATGYRHTCAVTGLGAVQCWGDNDFGQLGTGAAGGYSTVPVAALLNGATSVAAGGFHTCGLASGGTVQCWGDNDENQLGSSTPLSPGIPYSWQAWAESRRSQREIATTALSR